MDIRKVLKIALEEERWVQPKTKVADMTWDELNEALLSDYCTGIPNNRAFDHSVKSPTQLHIDMLSLTDSIDMFRHNRRDEILVKLARAFHEEAPGNVYYLDGTRFKAQADTARQAHELMARINRRLAASAMVLVTSRGARIVCRGFGFSYGIGINVDDAVDSLHRPKILNSSNRYLHREPDCLSQVKELLEAGATVLSFRVVKRGSV